MTRYRKTNQNGEGLILGVALLMIVVAVFAKLFIPLLVIWLIYLVYYFYNKVYTRSNVMLIVLSVLTLISGACFGIMQDKQSAETTTEVPEVEASKDEPSGDIAEAEDSGSKTDVTTSGETGLSSEMSGSAGSPAGVSSNKSSSGTSACLHYEAGRCWDDLEMEAYSQGRYDKSYGWYGGSYYESDDCDSVCQDILLDAYEEGYYDGY